MKFFKLAFFKYLVGFYMGLNDLDRPSWETSVLLLYMTNHVKVAIISQEQKL